MGFRGFFRGEQITLTLQYGLMATAHSCLFGFENEVTALIEVYASQLDLAIGQLSLNQALKDKIIELMTSPGWIGTGGTEEVAKLGEKHDIVGAFLSALPSGPLRNEVLMFHFEPLPQSLG